MSCEKHGYTNNVVCPACDQETIDKYTVEWNIGYQDREYARLMGDPVLDVVKATNKEEAEHIAIINGVGGVNSVWAWKK